MVDIIYYYFIEKDKNEEMGILLIILGILCSMPLVCSQGTKFCSLYCSTSCSADLSNNCNNKCNTNWIVSGQTCIPNAASGWIIHGTTPDIAGGILGLTYSDGTTPTISACNTMSYYGFVPAPTRMTVSTTITTPYYSMVIYLGIISMDVNCWKSSCPGGIDYVEYWNLPKFHFVTFNDPLTLIASPTITSEIVSTR